MLNLKDYVAVVKNTPLVAIDFLIYDSYDRLLVGRRSNQPAVDSLMVPGGRIYKNESLKDSLLRISRSEFGMEFRDSDISFFGIYDHIYNEGPFFNHPNITSHYVVIAVKVSLAIEIANLPKDQHSSYSYLTYEEIINRDDVHFFTRQYASRAPSNKFL